MQHHPLLDPSAALSPICLCVGGFEVQRVLRLRLKDLNSLGLSPRQLAKQFGHRYSRPKRASKGSGKQGLERAVSMAQRACFSSHYHVPANFGVRHRLLRP